MRFFSGTCFLPRSCIFLILLIPALACAGKWSWMKGPAGPGHFALYGTQGVAAPENNPGTRYGGASWTAPDGSLWMFGGQYYDSLRSDLWRFEPATNQWTWIGGPKQANRPGIYGTKGVPDSANWPGARVHAVSWVDSQGNFWLFGGHAYGVAGYGPDQHNDLWKYDRSTGFWTWVHGSSKPVDPGVYVSHGVPDATSVPRSRSEASGWATADGSLWLFGGLSHLPDPETSSTYGALANDLWKYDPAANIWTWIHGRMPVRHLPGDYGTMGTPAPENSPGGRSGSSSWTDPEGKLWLFAGFGWGGRNTNRGVLNDLWCYDRELNQWTWIKGGLSAAAPPVHGPVGAFDAAYTPGSTTGAAAWTDPAGDFWLFGGSAENLYAYPTISSKGELWKFDRTRQMWALMERNMQEAVYEPVYGDPTSFSTPGRRTAPVAWSSPTGELWLFGGLTQFHSSPELRELNDLWKYDLGVRSPPTSRIANFQQIHVNSTGDGYQELIYNYKTGTVWITPYFTRSLRISHVPVPGHWIGIFHYDYPAGRFTQGIYTLLDLQ